MTKIVPYLLLIFCLISCGNNDDDDSMSSSLPPQEEERLSDFSTRLNNELLIAGIRCNGGETTEHAGNTLICERGDWLITVDDINTCSPDGSCTEIGVIPIIADLDKEDVITVPEFTFFEIDPESPVTASQQQALNKVWVRFDINGATEVVFR